MKAYINEDIVRYAIVGKEISPETNTPHLQGFVHLLERRSMTQMKKSFNARAHYELAKGTDRENEKYCSKEGTPFIVFGKPTSGTTERGGGFHKAEACAKAAHLLAEGKDIDDMAEEHQEEYEAMLSHAHIIEKHASCIKRKMAMKKGAKKYCQLPLRDWQYQLMPELMETPNDRQIVWYCDVSGGCGKTWLTRACFSKFQSIRFENSKSCDIKHAYNGERIVFFDLTRSQQEHFNYEAMETIKNGIMFSSKYDSAMKIFDHPPRGRDGKLDARHQ